MVADIAGKPTEPQAAMKTHLSHPTGIGAFDGQHGISLASSSIISADISDDAMSCEAVSAAVIASAIISCGACEVVAAIAGRVTGASARPAITRIASNRRMVKFRFTSQNSHRWSAMGGSSFLHTMCSRGPLLIGIKLPSAA